MKLNFLKTYQILQEQFLKNFRKHLMQWNRKISNDNIHVLVQGRYIYLKINPWTKDTIAKL